MNIKDIFAQNNLAIQETSYTCGPVSLLNILHLKGDFTHDEKGVARLCKAQPDIGTSNEALVDVAKQLGLEVVDEKQNAVIEDIEKQLAAGAYVIVNYVEPFHNDGHYAVVTEYDEQAIYLRDCFFGFLRLKKEDFVKFWYNSDKTIHHWYLAVR